jgi:hypothetical protein
MRIVELQRDNPKTWKLLKALRVLETQTPEYATKPLEQKTLE